VAAGRPGTHVEHGEDCEDESKWEGKGDEGKKTVEGRIGESSRVLRDRYS